jgi:flagellar biosynthetic protein FliQ
MNIDVVSMILNEAIRVVIIGSLPSVGAGLMIGLLIAIFQAITQIQEQTLTFVPKMIIVFLVIAATFPWLANLIMELCFSLWKNIPFYAR